MFMFILASKWSHLIFLGIFAMSVKLIMRIFFLFKLKRECLGYLFYITTKLVTSPTVRKTFHEVLSNSVWKVSALINWLSTLMTLLSLLSRQIYDAGSNDEHLKEVRKAALESTKAAVRRLSIKCAQGSTSSRISKTISQTSKKRNCRYVYPEMRYMHVLV